MTTRSVASIRCWSRCSLPRPACTLSGRSLDTHELAVVSQVNPDLELLHRPKVRVISDPVGLPLSEPVTLDLSDDDPATGAPVRQIIKTTDPQKYGIRVSDYLLA